MLQHTKITDNEPAAGVAQQTPPPLSDEAIVERVLAGDLAAFEVIMRRYNQRIFRVVRGFVNDESEAEDIVQDAYVRAYEHLGQFAGRAKFSTWLTKIAVHVAIDRRKRRRRLEQLTFNQQDSISLPLHRSMADGLDKMNANELSNLLAEAVEALPDDLRVVFNMRAIEEISTHETAECLELSESNVKVRLYRARQQLRRHIDQRLGQEVRQLYQFDGQRCDRIVSAVLTRCATLIDQPRS